MIDRLTAIKPPAGVKLLNWLALDPTVERNPDIEILAQGEQRGVVVEACREKAHGLERVVAREERVTKAECVTRQLPGPVTVARRADRVNAPAASRDHRRDASIGVLRRPGIVHVVD